MEALEAVSCRHPRTNYSDGAGPDPYPSPGGTFPFTATDTRVHPYAVAGTYNLVLRIIDDDGGEGEMLLVIALV